MTDTDPTVIVARVHLELETTKAESFRFGTLAEVVKRYGLHSQMQECIWIIAHDAAGNVHTIMELARGHHHSVDLNIPAALSAVLITGAPSFSLAHNHPTMSVLPSVSDRDLTNKITEASNVLGLLFEDHVIVEPSGDSFSFRAAGMMFGAERPKTRAASVPKTRKST